MKKKEIVWDNIEIEEKKIYKPGTYKGKFNYDNEEKICYINSKRHYTTKYKQCKKILKY